MTIQIIEHGEPTGIICDLSYLTAIMSGRKNLINEMIDLIIYQVPLELESIGNGIKSLDFEMIKRSAHTMKSSISFMGIPVLMPVLLQIEELAFNEDMVKIKKQFMKLNLICKKAVNELKTQIN
ncbi:MAG: Hpt domain-containing protein [Paludibacter sp.]|nr:Hpt domain-containing protein [Paludibacter sp.]